jgi:hypothetical protein
VAYVHSQTQRYNVCSSAVQECRASALVPCVQRTCVASHAHDVVLAGVPLSMLVATSNEACYSFRVVLCRKIFSGAVIVQGQLELILPSHMKPHEHTPKRTRR